MNRQTLIAIIAVAGLLLIGAGVGLNYYAIISGIDPNGGSQVLDLTFNSLVLKSDHPGFGFVLVGALMLAASFGATFLSGRYNISN